MRVKNCVRQARAMGEIRAVRSETIMIMHSPARDPTFPRVVQKLQKNY